MKERETRCWGGGGDLAGRVDVPIQHAVRGVLRQHFDLVADADAVGTLDGLAHVGVGQGVAALRGESVWVRGEVRSHLSTITVYTAGARDEGAATHLRAFRHVIKPHVEEVVGLLGLGEGRIGGQTTSGRVMGARWSKSRASPYVGALLVATAWRNVARTRVGKVAAEAIEIAADRVEETDREGRVNISRTRRTFPSDENNKNNPLGLFSPPHLPFLAARVGVGKVIEVDEARWVRHNFFARAHQLAYG